MDPPIYQSLPQSAILPTFYIKHILLQYRYPESR
jgi:hypothetical protein